MCGVFGIIGDYTPQKARRALATLAHRGQDHCGIVEERGFFLAHQRLSVTDNHHRSHQPLRYKNLLLSFNGEIYNHKKLRLELEGFSWQTHSDAEVVLAAYQRWGIECIRHFEGMFAFALVDENKLYLVRDRFGKSRCFIIKERMHLSLLQRLKQ